MKSSPQSRFVGAREAETILGISRSKLHALATSGELTGRIVDRRGAPRHWRFKRTDVLDLLAKGTYLRQRPKRRRQKQLWEQYFGAIPPGFTPAFRDGDRANTRPENLCLLPIKAPRKAVRRTRERYRFEWTRERLAFLRREFQDRTRVELAEELGVSLAVLTRQARRLRLRKRPEFMRSQARLANRLPVGTERVHEHTNTLWVKVALEGTPYQQWRPKQHVIWEAANDGLVPRGWCVIFKDGDKRNFDPTNLELATKREVSAKGFARFLAYPKPLQDVIKLNAKLGREIQQRQEREAEVESPSQRDKRHVSQPRRWTAEMDDVLYRDYPTQPVQSLIDTLGVTLSSLRQRARRLLVRRSPETIIAEARAASGRAGA